MQQIELKDAEPRLEELINRVSAGERIIIKKPDGSAFGIVPLSSKKLRPKFGSARGLVEMSDDFDDSLEDFEEYMP